MRLSQLIDEAVAADRKPNSLMAAAGGRSRPPRRRVDGVLLLDKPAGLSSNAALQRAKRLYRAPRRPGHTGTLDPLAIGPAAAVLRRGDQVRAGAARRAEGVCRDGALRRRDDHAATPKAKSCARRPWRSRAAELEAALPRFVGPISPDPAGVRGAQVPRPPLLRVRARRRRHPARRRAPIEIAAIELVDWAPPDAVLRVACGKGTYIRVLAEDIGAALGCVRAPRRRCGAPSSGPFSLAGAVTLDALRGDGRRGARLRCCCRPTRPCPASRGSTSTRPRRWRLAQGEAGTAPVEAEGTFRCYGPMGRFVGLVEAAGGALRSLRLARTRRAVRKSA